MSIYQRREALRRQRKLFTQRAYYHLAQAAVSRRHLDRHAARHHLELAHRSIRRVKAVGIEIDLLTTIANW